MQQGRILSGKPNSDGGGGSTGGKVRTADTEPPPGSGSLSGGSDSGSASAVCGAGGSGGDGNFLAWAAAAAPTCPQLALYSQADVLIPPQQVEAFATAQVAVYSWLISRRCPSWLCPGPPLACCR